ncbi:MAG TPA: acyltransferase [Burkholderiaceae bacterium]|nr:acyltransferase [Burkholderiaceae bacterium]
MNLNSLWPAAGALLVAATAVFLCDKLFGVHSSSVVNAKTNGQGSRHIVLNGLRGLVIFSVFMHHATIFHGFLRTGLWLTSQSYLQVHLGINKVFVLFMLSGFLFTTKLLNAKANAAQPFNWLQFYVSRTMRLVPVYFFMLWIVFAMIAVISDFTLKEPASELFKHIIQWASFTLFGAPKVNEFELTAIAGVVWSLPYEWFFYFMLPLLAWVFRMPISMPYLILAMAASACLVIWQPLWDFMSGFAFGAAMALIVRVPRLVQICSGRMGVVLVVVCLTLAATAFPTGMALGSRIFIFLAVTVMACGNSLMGLLKLRLFQSMGERSYSIYLLHSVVMYVMFKFAIGARSATLSGSEHWLVILASIAVFIPLCYFTYRWIEQPFIRYAPYLSNWLSNQVRKYQSAFVVIR